MCKESVKIGVVGTGNISLKFIAAARASDSLEVKALYSRSVESAEAFIKKAELDGLLYYTDLEEMLTRADIDAVYIASPNLCHDTQSILAMNHGKHVLVEKIIANDSHRLSLMIEASERNGVVLMEAMRPDFVPEMEVLREALVKIGKIRTVSLEYCQYSSRYDKFKSGVVLNAFSPELENSALADIGVYPLHTCIALFGLPKTVSGASTYLHNGFEGGGVIVLGYPDMTASITYSKICDSVCPSVFIGEGGAVTVDKISEPRKITVKMRSGEEYEIPTATAENDMVYEAKAFSEAIRGNLDYKKYLEISRETLAVFDKCRNQEQDTP